MPKLTKTVVDAAKPRERQYTVWCADLPGFGMYVQPTGRKSYFVDYRTSLGERRRMTIGRHGVLTTEDARKIALAHLGDATRGEDPALERKTRRTSLTVNELCDDYLAAARGGLILGKGGRPKKVSTVDTDESRISAHIRPLLGARRVLDVTKADISKFIADVTAGKTAKLVKLDKAHARSRVTGGAGAATRTTGLLGGIFAFATDRGVRADNPVRGVRRPADKKRQRRLSPPEYQRLGNVLREAAETLPVATAGIWLIALTGARISEIETFRRTAIQSDGRTAILDDTKGGRSLRPLSRQALAVLKRIEVEPGNPYVLPSATRKGGHFAGIDSAMERIRKRADLPGITAHTLRHSFASIANDLGYTVPTIGAIIGHGTGTVTADYIHTLDAALIAAADAIAGEVLAQMKTGRPSRK